MSRFHCFSMSCWHIHPPHRTMEVVKRFCNDETLQHICDIVRILHLCKAFTAKFLTNSLHISVVSCIRWPKLWKTYIFCAYFKWIYGKCVPNHLLSKNVHNGFLHKIHFHFTSCTELSVSMRFSSLLFSSIFLTRSHLHVSIRARMKFIFHFPFLSFIPFCTCMSWKNNSWTFFFV